MKLQVASCKLQGWRQGRRAQVVSTVNRQPSTFNRLRRAFSLVEVMVVMVLLSLIVLALMAVFNFTQSAFRTGVTQTDVLESGRATIDLLAADLRNLAPSRGANNGAVNFCAFYTNSSPALVQSLVGSSQPRVNVLERFFILSRNNVNGRDIWTGTGYVVDTGSATSIYPLYRFSASTNAGAAGPAVLFNNFINAPIAGMSHLMDGVVDLTVRAFDPNGVWMASGYTNAQNVSFPVTLGVGGCYMFSNTLPASVEIEMGVLEDRTLQRAESLPNNLPALPPNDRRTIYLQAQAGAVHIFRQRVSIPNVDPSAYQ